MVFLRDGVVLAVFGYDRGQGLRESPLMMVETLSHWIIYAADIQNDIATVQHGIVSGSDYLSVFVLGQAFDHEAGQGIVAMEYSAMGSDLHRV